MSILNLDKTLISKVVKELVDFENRKSTASEKLLGSYSKPVIIQVQLSTEIKESVIHPIRIQIPNSMFSSESEDHSVCVFCRSEDKEAVDEFLSNTPISGVKSTISLNQVKKLYSQYKEKKELLANHTHFVCDMRILNHLYNLLGKVFGKRNNYPLPMRLTNVKGLSSALNNVLSATYMYLSGKSISIKFGHTGMDCSEIVENIVSGLKSAISKFPKDGKTIQSIHCKLSDSPALPIYSRKPNDSLDYVKQRTLGAESKQTAVVVTKSTTGKKKRETDVTEGPVKKLKTKSVTTVPVLVKKTKKGVK